MEFKTLSETEVSGRVAIMEEMIVSLKSVPLTRGYEEVLYPGELEARNELRYREEGLQFLQDTINDLIKVARELGLESELPL